MPVLYNVVPASMRCIATLGVHMTCHLLLSAVMPGKNEFCYASTACRAAIRVLHMTKGAHQGRPVVPGKTPNGLSTDLYPIGSTIEVSPFVGEHTEAGNLVLSGSACD